MAAMQEAVEQRWPRRHRWAHRPVINWSVESWILWGVSLSTSARSFDRFLRNGPSITRRSALRSWARSFLPRERKTSLD